MFRQIARSVRTPLRAHWTRSSRRAFSSYPDHELVGLPALSPTMETGSLATWKLKEGDEISAGDVICQIETDKAVVDFEAQDDAFLAKILVPEGAENIAVGTPMMVTCESADDVAAFANYTPPESSGQVEAAPKTSDESPPKEEKKAEEKAPPAKEAEPPTKATPAPKAPEKKEVPKPSPKPAPKQASPTPPPSNLDDMEAWGVGIKKSAISFSLAKKQQDYVNKYGVTGTSPASSS